MTLFSPDQSTRLIPQSPKQWPPTHQINLNQQTNSITSYNMVHAQTFVFGASSIFFSVQNHKNLFISENTLYLFVNILMRKEELPVFALVKDICTTACIVITPFGSSPKGVLHCPTVLLFSKIFPAFINFMSFADLGPPFLSGRIQQT